MNGILVINKEEGYTSRDVVNIVSSIFKTKKIGHTGTLDPLATGVLVLCIEGATKLVEVLSSTYKEYEAEITLGIETDTLDITGNVINKEIPNLDDNQIKDVILKMKGHYEQEVPIYSAIKVKGKKLYQYARNKEEVILPKRDVEIKDIDIISPITRDEDKIVFCIRVMVSKGTYIRSLARDIALRLNTIGVMSKLKRIKQGNYDIKDSYTLDDIKEGNYKLLSIDDALRDYYSIDVDDKLEKLICNGVKIPNKYNKDVVYFKKGNTPLALYKDDNGLLRVWKMF